MRIREQYVAPQDRGKVKAPTYKQIKKGKVKPLTAS